MQIMIVDDDEALGGLLEEHCRTRGHQVLRVVQAASVPGALLGMAPDCVFLDVRLGNVDGLSLLPEFKARCPAARVVVMSGFEPLWNTSRASARGAERFLRKPLALGQVDAFLDDVSAQKEARPVDLVPGDRRGGPAATFVGASEAMIRVCHTVGLAARSGVTTLIEGESGVGKDLAARALHALREPGCPFIAVDCATIVETLFESELFGHERGAFTGALVAREGKVSQAEGGVLFLDEIAELSPRMQSKLLRFLQSRTFEPVGGTLPVRVNVQLVAATNRNLEAMVQREAFRADLYHRLNVLRIPIPPLREHREDIPALVAHYFSEIPPRIGLPRPPVTPDGLAALVAYDWPGNVRELENASTRLILQAQGRAVDRSAVAVLLDRASSVRPVQTLSQIERSAILAVLDQTQWRLGDACALLGISRPTLRRKMALYELSR